MAYNKKTWANGDLITKESMNNIENGIYTAHDEIETLKNNTSSGTGMTTEQAQQLSTAYQHSQTTHAPSNAEANVQVDWNVTDTNSDAYIKNKPTNLATTDQIPAQPNFTYKINMVASDQTATVTTTGTYPNLIITFNIPQGTGTSSGSGSDDVAGTIETTYSNEDLSMNSDILTISNENLVVNGNLQISDENLYL